MMFQDFQQEQLFQKAKSYFKNLMNYSLTRSFSFIKTWDSLSLEFGAEAVDFPSLYSFLQKRILNDPDFQFYLIYVNNLIKYDKCRLDMGLTNSVIFKILFIMLKKEDSRFKEKSIFKDEIGKAPELKNLKKVKTEMTSAQNEGTSRKIASFEQKTSPETFSNKKIQNSEVFVIPEKNKPKASLPIHQNTYPAPPNMSMHNKDFHKTQTNNIPKQPLPPPLYPMPPNQQISYPQNQRPNIPYMQQRGPRSYQIPVSSQMKINPIQSNLLHQLEPHQNIGNSKNINFINQGGMRTNLPVFQMQGSMMGSKGFAMSGSNSVYRGFGNSGFVGKQVSNVDMEMKKESMGQDKEVDKEDNAHSKIGKLLERSVLRKRASSGSRRERKSSLSDDTVSVSSSSISYSLGTKEESKKKSKIIYFTFFFKFLFFFILKIFDFFLIFDFF
jgi:hypothetical protein